MTERERQRVANRIGENGWLSPGRDEGRDGPLGWLKSELSAAVVIATCIMLATGWLLTAARLANEELPSDSILSALPAGYFVAIALKETLSAFLISLVAGIAWLRVNDLYLPERSPRTKTAAWAAFGILLTVVSFVTAAALNEGTSRVSSPRYLVPVLTATAVAAGVAAMARRWADAPDRDGHPRRHRRRRRIAATIVLCFLVAGGARLVDARFATDVLPIAQVLVKTPCISLTDGKEPAGTAGTPRAAASARCLLGGFYLGESSKWIFLARPRNPCQRTDRSRPFLLTIPRDDVEQTMIASQSDVDCSVAK